MTGSRAELANAIAAARRLGLAAIALRTSDPTPHERQFAFVTGRRACFLLMPRGSTPEMYNVQSVSAQQMVQLVQASLPAQTG